MSVLHVLTAPSHFSTYLLFVSFMECLQFYLLASWVELRSCLTLSLFQTIYVGVVARDGTYLAFYLADEFRVALVVVNSTGLVNRILLDLASIIFTLF